MKWTVVFNGRLPALRSFASFNEAVQFVVAETGETEASVIRNFEAGCPSISPVTGSEFDIEQVKE